MSTRTILSQKLRPFKIDIYGLQDNYLGVLQSYNDNSLGQVIEPKIQVSKDGSQSFSCSIPKYIIDVTTNQKKLNPRWGDFENGVLAENTRVLKAFVNFENETKVFPFIIDKIEDKRDAHYSVFKKIEGTGLAFAELGKLGYKLELNESLVNREQKDDPKLLTTIQYWLDKVFPNEKDENGNIIRWLTPWCYEIRMDWSYHSDIDKAINASSFDTLDNTFLLNLSKLYSQSPRESDKIYDSGYISSWNVDENDNLLAAGYTPPQEKCRIIDCVNSNKYNITQTLAETYEVFCEYEYKCANNGTFVKEYIDDNGKIWMGRKVIFYNDGIKLDNPLYIDYQKNLQSITRTSDSSELFTKLYITPSQSESMDTGYITIADTLANPILDDFILNFDYLYSVGSISSFQRDFIKTYEAALRRINLNLMETAPELDDIIVEINELTAEKEMLEKQITSVQEELSDYETLRDNDVYQKKIIKDKTNVYSVVFTEDGQFYKASLRLEGISKGTIKGYNNISYEDSTLIFEGETMATIKAITDIPAISEESEEEYYVLTDDYDYPVAIYCNKIPSHTIVYLSLEYCPKNKYTDICESFNNKINNYIQRKDTVSALLASLEETKTSLQKSYDNKLEEKELLNQKLEKVLGAALREGYWTPDQYQDSRQSIERQFNKETLMFDTELFDSETPSYTTVGKNTIYYPYYKIKEQLLTAFNTHSPEDLIIHLQRDFEGTVQETTTLASGNYYFLYNRQKYYFTLKDKLIKDDKLIIKVDGDKLTLLQLHNNKETAIELEDANNNGTNLTSFFEGIGQFLGDYLLYNQAGFIYSFKKEADKIVPILLFNNDNYLSNYSKYYKIGYSFQGETKITLLDDGYLKNVPVYTNGNLLANTPYEICYPRMALPENNIQYNSENLKITLTNGVESIELKKYYDYSILLREGKVYITLKITENNGIHKLLNNNYYYNIIYEVSRANEVLFLDAKTVAKDNSTPRFSYDLSVASVPKITDEKITSIELGQLAYISDPILGVNAATGYVSEITFVLDEPQKDEIKIQNYKTKFEDLFSTITASSEAMKVNQASYDLAASSFLSNGSITSTVFQNTLNSNDFFFNYSTTGVDIDPVNGITLTNKKPYANGVYGQMVLQGDGIYLSSSINEATGERIWNTGITPQGISASALVAGSLDTSLIKIYSGENLAFQWNGEGLFAYKRDESGLPSTDSYVKYSDQGLHFIVNEADHSDNCQVSLGWDGLKLSAQSGALTLTAQDGLQIFYPEQDGKTQAALQVGRWAQDQKDYYGLRLFNKQGQKTFSVNEQGDLALSGTMQSFNYVPGLVGSGWQINQDGNAEFNNVKVRGTLSASVFEYDETTAVGGSIWVAPTVILTQDKTSKAVLQENSENQRLYIQLPTPFKTISGTGKRSNVLCGRAWKEYDEIWFNGKIVSKENKEELYEIKQLNMQISSLSFNTDGSPKDKLYFMLVEKVTDDNYPLIFYDNNGALVEEEANKELWSRIFNQEFTGIGDWHLIFRGEKDQTEGILITAMEEGAPYIDIYDTSKTDTNSNIPKTAPKVRLGKLEGLKNIDGIGAGGENALFSDIGGYGLYADNVYLRGAIYATSGKIGSLTVKAVENNITNVDFQLTSSTGFTYAPALGKTAQIGLDLYVGNIKTEQFPTTAGYTNKDVRYKYQYRINKGSWTNLSSWKEWSTSRLITLTTPPQTNYEYRGVIEITLSNGSIEEKYTSIKSFACVQDGLDGKNGNSIERVTERYGTSAQSNIKPTNWVKNIDEITLDDKDNKYLWIEETTEYSILEDKVSVRLIGAYGDQGLTGKGLKSITNYYLLSKFDDASELSTDLSKWQEEPNPIPVPTSQEPFLWNIEVIKYDDNTTNYRSKPRVIGQHGNGITYTEEQYGISASATEQPAETEWKDKITDVVANNDNPYLWIKETIYYSNGEPDVIIRLLSKYTENGRGIDEIINWYISTDRNADIDLSNMKNYKWQKNTRTTIDNNTPFLWNYEQIVYKNADNSTSEQIVAPRIIGVYSEDGKDGKDGEDGEDGRGISDVQETYAVSSSNTEAPVTGWGKLADVIGNLNKDNKYLWCKEIIYYTGPGDVSSKTFTRVISNYSEDGQDGRSIVSMTNWYWANNYATKEDVEKAASLPPEPNENTWTQEEQDTTLDNRYLWNYEILTYSKADANGKTTETFGPRLLGVHGKNGEEGRGVTDIDESYAISSSNITPPDVKVESNWSTNFKTVANSLTKDIPYLWCREKIVYTQSINGQDKQYITRVIGTYGEGISSMENWYWANNHATKKDVEDAANLPPNAPANTWTQKEQETSELKPYLWNYEIINYTNILTGEDVKTQKTFGPRLLGVQGSTGSTGPQGPEGPQGPAGPATVQYELISNVTSIIRDLGNVVIPSKLTFNINKIEGATTTTLTSTTGFSLTGTINKKDGTSQEISSFSNFSLDISNYTDVTYKSLTIYLKKGTTTLKSLTIPFELGDNLRELGKIEDGKVIIDEDRVYASSIAAGSVISGKVSAGAIQTGAIAAGSTLYLLAGAGEKYNAPPEYSAGPWIPYSEASPLSWSNAGEYASALEDGFEAIWNATKPQRYTNGVKISSDGVFIRGGGKFEVDMENFKVTSAGNVEIKGKINATSGQIGSLTIGQVENELDSVHIKITSAAGPFIKGDNLVSANIQGSFYTKTGVQLTQAKLEDKFTDISIEHQQSTKAANGSWGDWEKAGLGKWYKDQYILTTPRAINSYTKYRIRLTYAKGEFTNTVYSDELVFAIAGTYILETADPQYAKSNSGTTPPTEGWGNTIPETTVNEFLWTKIVIKYSDDSETISYSVAAHGATGPTGPDGAPALMYRLNINANEVVRDLTGTTPSVLIFNVIENKGGIDRAITDLEEFKGFNLEISGKSDYTYTIPDNQIRKDDKLCWELRTSNLYPRDIKQWTCTLTGPSSIKETTTFAVVPGDSINELGKIEEDRVIVDDGRVYANSLAAYAVTAGKIAAGAVQTGGISSDSALYLFSKSTDNGEVYLDYPVIGDTWKNPETNEEIILDVNTYPQAITSTLQHNYNVTRNGKIKLDAKGIELKSGNETLTNAFLLDQAGIHITQETIIPATNGTDEKIETQTLLDISEKGVTGEQGSFESFTIGGKQIIISETLPETAHNVIWIEIGAVENAGEGETSSGAWYTGPGASRAIATKYNTWDGSYKGETITDLSKMPRLDNFADENLKYTLSIPVYLANEEPVRKLDTTMTAKLEIETAEGTKELLFTGDISVTSWNSTTFTATIQGPNYLTSKYTNNKVTLSYKVDYDGYSSKYPRQLLVGSGTITLRATAPNLQISQLSHECSVHYIK